MMVARCEVVLRLHGFGVLLGEFVTNADLAARPSDNAPCITLKFHEYMGADEFGLVGREIIIPLGALFGDNEELAKISAVRSGG